MPTSALPGAASGDFLELEGVISINAGHFASKRDLSNGAGWRSVPGLGRTGSAVTILPSTAEIPDMRGPRLSYRFNVAAGADATVHVRLLPTYPLISGQPLKLAIAIDEHSPLPLSVNSGFDNDTDEWKRRVVANATGASLRLPRKLTSGWHTLHLIGVDAGVVVDKIVIDLGGLQSSYDGPPETRIR